MLAHSLADRSLYLCCNSTGSSCHILETTLAGSAALVVHAFATA